MLNKKEISRRWIEAGIEISHNPKANVLCPKCNLSYLDVRDVFADESRLRWERYMTCPNCGAANILLMSTDKS